MRVQFIILTIFILNYCFGEEFLREKPDYVIQCKYKDSNYVPCLTESVQKWFTKAMKEGLSKDIPAIEPFVLESLKVEPEGGTNAANFKADLKNLRLKGLADAIVKESKLNLENVKWDSKIILPKVHIDSDYKFDGNLLLLPLKGMGKLTIDIDELKIGIQTTSTPYKIDGFTFLNITNVDVKRMQISGMKVHMENLFNGNKELEDATNDILNQSWKDFYEALKPTLVETISETMLRLFKPVMRFIPMSFVIENIEQYLKA